MCPSVVVCCLCLIALPVLLHCQEDPDTSFKRARPGSCLLLALLGGLGAWFLRLRFHCWHGFLLLQAERCGTGRDLLLTVAE
jgi:hypothetical protein